MQRTNYSSGTQWEETFGYSRAVKIGNTIEVAGTVAVNEKDELVGRNSAYEQAKYILQKIEKVLTEAGATLNDVTRTRMFVTDISKSNEFGKAHGEVFRSVRPCTSMIEVKALISPEYLVEIEATAIIQDM
jgi:enamine deaminase RidA (YjgF/YER057c/UK114 family)